MKICNLLSFTLNNKRKQKNSKFELKTKCRNFGFGLLKSYLTFGFLTFSDRSKKFHHSTLVYVHKIFFQLYDIYKKKCSRLAAVMYLSFLQIKTDSNLYSTLLFKQHITVRANKFFGCQHFIILYCKVHCQK